MKQKRKLRFRILAMLTVCVSMSTKADLSGLPYSFKQITIQNGLSHTDANSIVQDEKGYIWIGTYSGLNRYDGFRIKSFYNNDNAGHPYMNRIANISIDRDGLLWLATQAGIQLFDPFREKFLTIKIRNQVLKKDETDLKKIIVLHSDYLFTIDKHYQVTMYSISKADGKYALTKEPFSLNANCYAFFVDKRNEIWFSTNQGIWKLTTNNNLSHYKTPELFDEVFFTFLDDHHLFLSNEDKLMIYDHPNDLEEDIPIVELKNGEPVSLSRDYGKITDIKSVSSEEYWISTWKGLFVLNKANGKFTSRSIYQKDYLNGLSSDFINQLLIDKSHNLFAATYAGGVNIIDLKKNPFSSIRFTPSVDNNIIPEKIVRSVVCNDEYLWIGSNAMGLTRIHKKTRKHWFYQTNQYSELKSNEIRAMLFDRNELLWVGSTKGINIIKSGNNRNVSFVPKQQLPFFPEIEVSAMAVDCFNQIWVGTWFNGICRIRKDKNGLYETDFLKHTQIDSDAFTSSSVITIFAHETRPELYFSTGEKLVRVFMDSHGEIEKTWVYQAKDQKEYALSSNFICSIQQKNDSTLWIGSIGGGFSEMQLFPDGKYRSFNYQEENGLHIKDVECIEKDNQGNVWLGGNELVKYSQKTKSFKSYLVGGNSYKVGSSFKDKNGILYFGGIDGLTWFNPDDIEENKTPAIPEISALRVNNTDFQIAPNEKGIAYSDKIRLKYNQNNFNFDFFISNNASPEGYEFKYRLKGYETEFNTIAHSFPFVSYANLKPGKYELELFAINNDGLMNPEKRSLQIIISPPWWLSWIAKTIYIILFILAISAIFFYFYNWINLKKKLEIQDLKDKQKEKLHQMQLQFFTNISHEFRTPLTLIHGVSEQLQSEQVNLKQRQQLGVLLSNVKRMTRLVNELMDFRKAETGHFKLSVQKKNISDFTKEICNEFENIAKEKNVLFDIQINRNGYNAWFDPKIIEKIVLNLLNNAFKYIKEGGYIQVSVFSDLSNHITPFENKHTIQSDFNAKSYVYVSVKDNGVGISRQSIEKVFDRFYQVEDSEYAPHLGSGIGLALVKSLILLHKGNLTIFSERNKGTEFIAAIPSDKEDYTESETGNKNSYIPDEEERYILEHIPNKQLLHSEKTDHNQKLRILLAEDNDEVRTFLSESLSEEFDICEVANGSEALKKIEENIPDLVVSDVMMPVMNGFELCKKMKADIMLGSIPFIMLTAKDSLDDNITGIECGADAYIVKPVSIKLIVSTIRNLLNQRGRVKKALSDDYLSKAITDTLQEKDREFYEQLIHLIDRHLANTNLDVDLLSREMNYSRTKLYQRVSDITGKSVMDFVRSIRLRKATQYMAEDQLTIYEIMEKVGIQSQSNFSSSFKKEYGKTPTRFIQELKKK